MREQLKRFLSRAILVGSPRQWLHQWAVVANHRQSTLIEEIAHLRHVRVKSKRASACRRDRKKLSLRNSQVNATCSSIRGILLQRDKHVVAVISAVQKNTNERFVVRGSLRRQS